MEDERGTEIERRARFDLIRYANCWEDPVALGEALEPGPGRRVLSIASAGDNSFWLLASGAEVVAADLSPAQLALVELKAAAIRRLERPEALAFLGLASADPADAPGAHAAANSGDDRAAVYRRLAPDLSETARAFWDGQAEAIRRGVVHGGKFERYFQLFRRRILPWVHGRSTVEALLAPRTAEERQRFYDERWNTWRWRLLFRIFFSRWVMGRLGRDPEFFRYVEGSVAPRILERTRYALTVLPTHENPYLEYILRGAFRDALPPYAEPETFDAVRDGLDRLTLHLGPIQEAAEAHRGGGFDGFNLSDIFEYLDPETSAAVYGELLEHARPGARFAYWNMLVPRRRPEAFSDRVRSLDGLAERLFAEDRAFFYSALVVEEAR